jgi:tRNA splicing ligase
MPKLASVVIAALLTSFAASAQTSPQEPPAHGQADAPSKVPNMPSEAEIGELINKASEYVDTYKRTFTNAKASIDKAPTNGFDQSAATLADQASGVITAIKKNGSTGVALLSLLTILDDMSLNAQKASAVVMIVALREDKTNRNNHAMQDFQDLAQAGKNCYDISELLFHAAIRYISAEETALRVLLDKKPQ